MSCGKEEKIYKSFVISICLAVGLSLSGIFLGMVLRTRNLIHEELTAHARAYFGTIVATRLWNAHYGGVYVEKKGKVTSNPYIRNADIETKDGRVFTLRNPAMMTREVSEYIGTNKDFSFHITSKELLNPHNKPDAFERDALNAFEKGAREVFRTELINNKTFFRFMGPLYVQESCLQCHGNLGYKVGDVRGGISVGFSIEDVNAKLKTNAILVAVFAVTTTALLIAILWYLTKRLIRRVAEAREQIEQMAITDVLTGLYNRRHVLERFEEEFDRAKRLKRPLSCIMLDIDHFKSINDTHGHLVGDEVLREVADRIKQTLRKYDIVGRYGGEEFLIILPDTDVENGKNLSERIRAGIKAPAINSISVTVSLGVTQCSASDSNVDDIIRRSDEKLYEAKSAGRDCVRHC